MKAQKRIFRASLVLLASVSFVFVWSCGGSKKGANEPSKTGQIAGTDTTTAPTPGATGATKADDISTNVRADYEAAVANYKQQKAAGWTSATCKSTSSQFEDIGKRSKLVEGYYMAGLVAHECGDLGRAESQYKKANSIRQNAWSQSGLAQLAFERGDQSQAKAGWERAVAANPKLTGARNNLAWLMLQQMRRTSDKAQWKQLDKDAQFHLSSSLAVDSENVRTYVIYSLVYMEGYKRNRSRLDLAQLLLDEGKKRDVTGRYAPLYNALGLLQLRRQNQARALKFFRAAVALDTNSVEARMNVGLITLAFRKYDSAKVEFETVLAKQPKNYEAQIGLGIAVRGLGNLTAAEESYKKAMALDATKAASYFNLGVLYKDFQANKANTVTDSKKAYETARNYFRQALTRSGLSSAEKADAKDNITDCDKIIGQLNEAIKLGAK